MKIILDILMVSILIFIIAGIIALFILYNFDIKKGKKVRIYLGAAIGLASCIYWLLGAI